MTLSAQDLILQRAVSQTIINVPPDVAPTTIGSDTILNVFDGGIIGDSFFALPGSVVVINGGMIGDNFRMRENVSLSVSGGTFGRGLSPRGGPIEFIGGEFQLNGTPLLDSSIPSVLPDETAVFTGTFADGSPFLFSNASEDNFFGITLTAVDLPIIDTTPMLVDGSTAAAPVGLRVGQMLTLREGGSIGANFASIDATLSIEGGSVASNLDIAGSTVLITGGTVGDGVLAADSTVHLNGGTVGDDFYASNGTSVEITDGALGDGSILKPGSSLTISGGSIGSGLRSEQSIVNIEGGSIGQIFRADESIVNIRSGIVGAGLRVGNGTANISGGMIEGLFNAFFSITNISGGTIDGPFIASHGEVNLKGTEFFLDGVPLDLEPGISTIVTERDVPLTGILADGSPFAFDLYSTIADGRDFFQIDTELTVTLVPEPATCTLALAALCLVLRRSR